MENLPIIAPSQEYRETETTYVQKAAMRAEWLKEGRTAWKDYQQTGLHLTNEEVMDWMNKIIDGENAPMPKCHT